MKVKNIKINNEGELIIKYDNGSISTYTKPLEDIEKQLLKCIMFELTRKHNPSGNIERAKALAEYVYKNY
ncbi:MAG: hypothetical protein ACOCP8_10315 [archaeon]